MKCSIIRPMSSSFVKALQQFAPGLSCCLIVVGILLPLNASALPVTGLYNHRIQVANESDSERSRAFKEALAAVITKVTGDERWLLDPAIVSAGEGK